MQKLTSYSGTFWVERAINGDKVMEMEEGVFTAICPW